MRRRITGGIKGMGASRIGHKHAEVAQLEESKIYHIARSEDLEAAHKSGEYRCESLADEDFIHCCLARQLNGVIERYYTGVDGLQLLEIDPQQLKTKLVYENTVGGDELFPHVYGPINMDAVLSISPKPQYDAN